MVVLFVAMDIVEQNILAEHISWTDYYDIVVL